MIRLVCINISVDEYTADRDVEVTVTGDADAFLRLAAAESPNGEYAQGATDGTLELKFTDTDAGGEGFNPESVTSIHDVFVVRNQGTQPVELVFEPGEESVGTVIAPDVDQGDQQVMLTIVANDERVDDPLELDVGDEQTFSVVATVSEAVDPPAELEQDEITFIAEADTA